MGAMMDACAMRQVLWEFLTECLKLNAGLMSVDRGTSKMSLLGANRVLG